MRKIHCLNPIASVGTDIFDENYELTDNINEAEEKASRVRQDAYKELERLIKEG